MWWGGKIRGEGGQRWTKQELLGQKLETHCKRQETKSEEVSDGATEDEDVGMDGLELGSGLRVKSVVTVVLLLY